MPEAGTSSGSSVWGASRLRTSADENALRSRYYWLALTKKPFQHPELRSTQVPESRPSGPGDLQISAASVSALTNKARALSEQNTDGS